LNSDAEVVENSLSTNVSMFLRSGTSILASIIIIFVLQPILAATFLAGFVPILFFFIKFGLVMKDNAKAVSREKAKMSSVAEESIGNVRIVKAFANEKREIREFGKFSDEVYKIGLVKAKWTAGQSFFTQFCLYGAMMLIIYVASKLYKEGEISIGLVTTYLFYLQVLQWNFMIMNYCLANVMQVVGASDKLVKIIEREPKINSTGGLQQKENIEGRIELKNVKFRYPSKPDV
jgi:ABC-type multidrug transport system fused ATPase/permease subunit